MQHPRTDRRTFLLASFGAAAGFLLPAAANAKETIDESEALYNDGKVLNLNVELGTKELESLRREQRKYVTATLKEDDKIVYKDVAVHLKGAAGSFRGIDEKASLTVNMDKFSDGQRFHGIVVRG